MIASRGSMTLLAVALLFQGFAAVMPHDHGPTCDGRPALEARENLDAPHHCLACSIHAPAAAVDSGVVVVRSETCFVPVVAMVPIHGVSAPAESSGPRGPPRVV